MYVCLVSPPSERKLGTQFRLIFFYMATWKELVLKSWLCNVINWDFFSLCPVKHWISHIFRQVGVEQLSWTSFCWPFFLRLTQHIKNISEIGWYIDYYSLTEIAWKGSLEFFQRKHNSLLFISNLIALKRVYWLII